MAMSPDAPLSSMYSIENLLHHGRGGQCELVELEEEGDDTNGTSLPTNVLDLDGSNKGPMQPAQAALSVLFIWV